MSRIRLKYVDHFTDRHGEMRFYFRRPKGKRTPLKGAPGSDEFMAGYAAALAAQEVPEKKERGAAGTFDRLVATYFQSSGYLTLKAPTQRQYRFAIERLMREETLGHRKVADFRREHLKRIMAKRVDRPSSANDALKKLRILCKFALDLGWRKDDPTLHVKKFAEGEHHTWSDDEVEAFEARWPIGSQQRTIFALLLYTGQRLSDMRRMAWADVSPQKGHIRVTQEKTGTALEIALHPDLLDVLAAWPRTEKAIVVTTHGEPFSVNGLGNKVADAIHAAGLPEACVAHGLRKAAARRLAEAGCSPHEIASITGHRSLSEVERYTRAANQRRLSEVANTRLGRRSVPNPDEKDTQPPEETI